MPVVRCLFAGRDELDRRDILSVSFYVTDGSYVPNSLGGAKNKKIDDAYNSNIVDFLLDLFGIITPLLGPGMTVLIHVFKTLLDNLGIYLCGRDVHMPHHLLDILELSAIL